MIEGKTRIPPVDVETLPDDSRETLEEQQKLRGGMIIAWENSSSRFNRAFHIPSQGFWKP